MILVDEGHSPLILCLPHTGTDVPEVVGKRFNATGRSQTDLSWRLEDVLRLGDELDATTIRSTVSRYLIDLDRDAETPLSAAGNPATALCPVTTLDGKGLYLDDEEPGGTEVEQRVLLFHQPFHRALRQQINRLLASHSKVILIDCQSMRSSIKGVTDKGLPLVSVGTADGTSCDPDLRSLLIGSFTSQQGFTVAADELAKGGYITRTYGQPEKGVHAATLLIAQRAYLRHESPPFEPDKIRVHRVRTVFQDTLSRAVDWTTSTGGVEPVTEDEKAKDSSPEDGPVETEKDLDTKPAGKDPDTPEGKPPEPPLMVAE